MNKKIILDIETRIAVDTLSELPTSALATALVFAIAENISALDPPSDDEQMNIILTEASMQAVQLAEGIDILFNSTKEITRH
jgi:hypothetical protein|tara:strand:+ start:1747 stop:1992 length:246 start_codon:yes stop_codon:yes gene_type:complete